MKEITSHAGHGQEERWWQESVVFGQELLLNLPQLSDSGEEGEETAFPTFAEGWHQAEIADSANFRVFERMLTKELSWQDSIHESFQKIVRVALAAKYGLTAAKLDQYKGLIEKLVNHMEQDSVLRKRALYLVCLFCQQTL